MGSPNLVWNPFTNNFDYTGAPASGVVDSITATAPLEANGESGVPQVGDVVLSYNGVDLHAARFIVSPNGSADGANYTDIAGALTAAVTAGGNQTVVLQPATYTQDFTLPENINLVGMTGDESNPNVTILGKVTASYSGSSTISNIKLKTNSDNFLVVNGSNATKLYLNNCYLDNNNNTGINFSSSNSSAAILADHCRGDIDTTGIAVFNMSSPGNLKFIYCDIHNTGLSTTPNTISAGFLNVDFSIIRNPTISSGSGTITIDESALNTSAINATCLTIGGSGNGDTTESNYLSGSATSIVVNSEFIAQQCTISSTNTSAISGSGSLSYSALSFLNSSLISTTTQVPLVKSNDAKTVVTPGAYPYTVQPQDAIILVNTASARTINLEASPVTGIRHIIKDNTGNAAADNITVTPAAGNIDGSATYVINSNYGAIELIYNGTKWNVI